MPNKSRRSPSADEIAEMATPGEDVSKLFTNQFTVVRPVRRVNVDLTQGMLRELDERVARLNVSRQAIIKTLLGHALDHERPTRTPEASSSGGYDMIQLAAADPQVDGGSLLRTGIEYSEHTNMKPKNTICLWFPKDAHEAARFYAATFPDSEVTAVHKAPSDYPGGKQGDVLTVEFTVLGTPCLGLNGGPEFSEAFSFQIATDTQEETDRYWNAIVGNGGKESQCGWCKDRWGLSWQITPRALTEALAAGGGEAKRAFEAMMGMKKIDIATIEAARRGT